MKLFYSFFTSLIFSIGFTQTLSSKQEVEDGHAIHPKPIIVKLGSGEIAKTSSFVNPNVGMSSGKKNLAGKVGSHSENNKTTSVNFHDTQGSIDVSGNGDLQYNLPIALPPGIRSVAPQINLVYSSSSPNGIAGYGWNISGISAITRVKKSISKDGEVRNVQLDDTDYFAFNGQRLILKSGQYGQDGAEYVTEKYSAVRIKSYGTTQSSGGSPLYFHVTFENGSQAWYGGTEQDTPLYNPSRARSLLEYNIVKWVDNKRNYILYYYNKTSNQDEGSTSNIGTISWGSNYKDNVPPINRMTFTYAERSFVEQSYVGGHQFTQNKILKEILVESKNEQFKKYVLQHFNNGTNYEFVNSITEYNSANQPANPVSFQYPSYVASGLEFAAAPNNVDDFNNVKLSGDFNGDSYVDFIMNNGTVKLGAFDNNNTQFSSNITFSQNAKIVSTLIDTDGQISAGNGIVQYENGYVCGYILKGNSFVKVFNKLIYQNDCEPNAITCSVTHKIETGDVNGDGVDDVFITLSKRECFASNNPDPPFFEKIEAKIPINSQCYTNEIGKYIIDLKSDQNPISTYTFDYAFDDSQYRDQKYLDTDNDGVVNVLNISNSSYTVFDFVPVGPNEYLKKIRFSGNLLENRDSAFALLIGDYNGDGNIDFAIPTTDSQNADNWRFYMGTAKGFTNFLKTNFLTFRKPDAGSTGTFNLYRYFYTVSDVNKDGKSDIIAIKSFNNKGQYNQNGNSNYRTFGYDIYTLTAAGLQFEGDIAFTQSGNLGGYNYVTFNWQEYDLFAPITSQIKVSNSYYDVFLYWKERVHKLKSPTPVAELSHIKNITQAGSSVAITYKELNPVADNNFYKKVKPEVYPYFSLARVDKTFIVSQLTQGSRKQEFRYRGMTGNLHGKGLMGFHQSARSNWYANGYENTVVWSGSEMDIENDGLPAKEWSIRTSVENQIFPDDLSENNSQLLTFSSTKYKNDKLLNGSVVTGNISEADKPKIVDARVVEITKEKNFLTNVLRVTNYTYNTYYLPATTTVNVNNGYSVTTTSDQYFHNTAGIGADYYVGRLKSSQINVQAYSDTKSWKSEYAYTSNLLQSYKVYNRDNTGFTLESYTYDDFGNLTGKVISNSVDSQNTSVSTIYDTDGRFVSKKIDNLGLETNLLYNTWGQVTKETDALGNTITNAYDGWGKLLSSSSSISGVTSYQYDKDNSGNIIISQFNADGNISRKYTNNLGQNYKSSTKAFGQGQFVSIDVQYDVLGRKTGESEPYFDGQNPTQWNTVAYDDGVFPPKATVTSFNGKQVETSIIGLTTTIKELNGYQRTSVKKTDALENVISSTDPGGTITFIYNALGEQIRARYAETTVTTKYDVWGRKSEFLDPSNGLYKYEYTGLGLLRRSISPKGYKEYRYNAKEQIIQQIEVSSADGTTDKRIAYQYDDFGKIILKSGTSQGKFSSVTTSFDTQGKLLAVSESANGKIFSQKEHVYDNIGRLVSYEKQIESSGILTKVAVENVYNPWNGELYLIKDKNSGKVLWQLQATNERGQVLNAKLGEAGITNVFDSNGFLSSTNHSSAVKPGILQISYSFDAVKNELNSRFTGGDFSITESFDYDTNNRLINWTNPVTGVKPQNSRNVYDAKGRITQNDQVGTIKFENSAKVYQSTGMTLNAAGVQNYNSDLIQNILYNENNDPVFINGEKGDVGFEYGLVNMRQRVTYGGNFNSDAEGKFTKYYNEGADAEIVRDNITGNEKHIIYIGGNPYDSNIIFVKNYTESTGTYKFLHKDYIGSILAVSDEAGYKVEQRHFDAWGNFTHLQIGNGPVITDKNVIDGSPLILERGYTSHEHFAEVGLIHMNGRLYDPLLRRFLNADENIQDPFNTQNYNKYGYVLNNPLMFNDPSGEFIQLAAIPLIVKVLAVAVVSYTANILINKKKFNILDLYSTIVINLLSAGVTNVIGDVFSTAAKTLGNEALRSLVHGGVQGTLSFMQGGSPLEGFASGFMSSIGVYGMGEIFGKYASTFVGSVSSGMLFGGAGSALAGGNFWRGAAVGAIVAGFNHYLHKIPDTDDGDPRKPTGSKRITSKKSSNSLKGSRGPQSVVTPENPGNQVGNGSGIFVPSGSESVVIADVTYYDDGTVDINMTTKASRHNTTGSYVANYEIFGPNGKRIEGGFLVNKGYGIKTRMDYATYDTGVGATLSTAVIKNIPINSTIKVNVGLTSKIPMGATGAIMTNHLIKVQ